MNYVSIKFAIFVLIIFISYYILPLNRRWLALLGGNIVFYLSFGVRYSVFLIISILFSFCFAKMIESSKTIKKKKVLLLSVIIILVLVLLSLKFYNWSVDMIEYLLFNMFDIHFVLPDMGLIMPVGISFYTLQIIGYLYDVYKEKFKAERNLLQYILFISFFPIIVQGPISRYGQLKCQLVEGHRFDYDKIVLSLQLIMWGAFKKLVIADGLGIFVNSVFENYLNLYGLLLYINIIFYSFQLYMDFSGCVDICRGVSGIFGIELTQNFRQPYFSTSIKELIENI